MNTYKFIGLLEETKEGNITGPMSQILFISEIALQMEFKINGLVQVDNNQSDYSYGHLIAKCSNGTYVVLIDMGVSGLPVGIYFKDTGITLTPVYQKEVKQMAKHRKNVELPGRSNENPIMKLDKKGWDELIKQAIESGEFTIKKTV